MALPVVTQHNAVVSDPPAAAEPPAVSAAADALYRRVERRIPKLARGMVDHFVAAVPIYAQLPREQLEGEVTQITADNLRLFFRTLREDRPPSEEELAAFRTSAARRAEERVPLAAVLQAYHAGATLAWQALVDSATEADAPVLLPAVGAVLRYIRAVTVAVAAAYLEEQQAISGEERDARRALALALLSGEPAETAAARVGVRLPESYVVLALQVGPHPDERDGGVGGAIAARRKLRRLQERLVTATDEQPLALLDPLGGTVLLPAAAAEVDALGRRLPELVAGLATAAGAPVWAGASSALHAGAVAVAAEQAREILRIVTRLSRPPGVYGLRDVLLEYQLSRSSDAVPLLCGLLDPLDRNPDLLRTLAAYFANDLDRRRTAAFLHVHPNTLDYRLRRVVELTGLDPATASGLQLLAASLAARDTAG
jgi:hypothetical protein